MQRTVLIALVTAVVAAGIAATATIMLTGDDDETVALPTLSPGVTPGVNSTVETPAPSPGGPPATTAASARSPAASPAATATPARTVEIRSAKSVDCEREPRFCSGKETVTLDAGRRRTSHSVPQTVKRDDAPTIAMTSELQESNGSAAESGDAVAAIHVEVEVTNSTDRTFVFDKREIVLEIYRNGRLFDSFSTKGEGFELTPGSKMTGEFDRPISQSGEYTWQAKIWYYRK